MTLNHGVGITRMDNQGLLNNPRWFELKVANPDSKQGCHLSNNYFNIWWQQSNDLM